MFNVLLMVKNESLSIEITIKSVRDYVSKVILFDTGSTDNTIEIAKKVSGNKFVFKQSIFKGFPESRNEAIEFAETFESKFIILMDAGDEFKSNYNLEQLKYIFNNNVDDKFKFGIVKKEWSLNNSIHHHNDVRLIRNRSNCRYNLAYPVHETFANKDLSETIYLGDAFILFQNRTKYGESSKSRIYNDIILLKNAAKNFRNYYYLGQSYMDIEDYENALENFINASEQENNEIEENNFDNMRLEEIYTCIGKCAISVNKDKDFILKSFSKAIDINKNFIDSYIYFFKYCIDTKKYSENVTYVVELFNLTKNNIKNRINNLFYDYTRYALITVTCIQTSEHFDIGKKSAFKAWKHSESNEDMIRWNFFKYKKSYTD